MLRPALGTPVQAHSNTICDIPVSIFCCISCRDNLTMMPACMLLELVHEMTWQVPSYFQTNRVHCSPTSVTPLLAWSPARARSNSCSPVFIQDENNESSYSPEYGEKKPYKWIVWVWWYDCCWLTSLLKAKSKSTGARSWFVLFYT